MNKRAGAIQSSARLLGQSIGAAMVALVFDISMGGRGAGYRARARGLLGRGGHRRKHDAPARFRARRPAGA
ncbi:MAG: hypothetical protein WA709_30145 [Stellaceae bacterium]